MYRRIDDFLAEWKTERAATLKLMEALTDASLAQKVYDEGRTLGYLAWHLPLCVVEMANRAGLGLSGPAENADAPESAAEIAAAYRSASEQLAEKVGANWTDAALEEEMNMYGENWKKGFILSVLVAHEVHHRGQMTVLMRQAGLRVTGVYGPAREEWAAYGMPTQK
ncbi:MAG: DinB family protein [Candidatus Latescibacterota bacterium]